MDRKQQREVDRAQARLAKGVAAYVLGVCEDRVDAPTRGSADAALARQIAMYLAHVAFEMSLQRVATAFDRDRSTVSHACHVIEDRRDDPAFDALIDALEETLRTAPQPHARRAA
jgi:chromosomal replication initiation ATPase DnaA